MKHWYMLTLVGKDQPNIVAHTTRLLYQAGCRLGEANMNRLGGSFTVMLMVEKTLPKTALKALLQPVVERFNLSLHVVVIEGDLHQHQIPNICVRVHGADRAGIVAQVTSALAQKGFNILELCSDVGGSQEQPFYILQIEGVATAPLEELQQALADLRDVQVEISAIDACIM
jgi:glycine cleavage system transcriptional repressor